MKRRTVPKGWKVAPDTPSGRGVRWVEKPEACAHDWVAYPGPRGAWLIKDKAQAGAQVHVFTSLEGFEETFLAGDL